MAHEGFWFVFDTGFRCGDRRAWRGDCMSQIRAMHRVSPTSSAVYDVALVETGSWASQLHFSTFFLLMGKLVQVASLQRTRSGRSALAWGAVPSGESSIPGMSGGGPLRAASRADACFGVARPCGVEGHDALRRGRPGALWPGTGAGRQGSAKMQDALG